MKTDSNILNNNNRYSELFKSSRMKYNLKNLNKFSQKEDTYEQGNTVNKILRNFKDALNEEYYELFEAYNSSQGNHKKSAMIRKAIDANRKTVENIDKYLYKHEISLAQLFIYVYSYVCATFMFIKNLLLFNLAGTSFHMTMGPIVSSLLGKLGLTVASTSMAALNLSLLPLFIPLIIVYRKMIKAMKEYNFADKIHDDKTEGIKKELFKISKDLDNSKNNLDKSVIGFMNKVKTMKM